MTLLWTISILPALIKGRHIEFAGEPNPAMVHCIVTINRHIDQQHVISTHPGFEGTGDQRYLFQRNRVTNPVSGCREQRGLIFNLGE